MPSHCLCFKVACGFTIAFAHYKEQGPKGRGVPTQLSLPVSEVDTHMQCICWVSFYTNINVPQNSLLYDPTLKPWVIPVFKWVKVYI